MRASCDVKVIFWDCPFTKDDNEQSEKAIAVNFWTLKRARKEVEGTHNDRGSRQTRRTRRAVRSLPKSAKRGCFKDCLRLKYAAEKIAWKCENKKKLDELVIPSKVHKTAYIPIFRIKFKFAELKKNDLISTDWKRRKKISLLLADVAAKLLCCCPFFVCADNSAANSDNQNVVEGHVARCDDESKAGANCVCVQTFANFVFCAPRVCFRLFWRFHFDLFVVVVFDVALLLDISLRTLSRYSKWFLFARAFACSFVD